MSPLQYIQFELLSMLWSWLMDGADAAELDAILQEIDKAITLGLLGQVPELGQPRNTEEFNQFRRIVFQEIALTAASQLRDIPGMDRADLHNRICYN